MGTFFFTTVFSDMPRLASPHRFEYWPMIVSLNYVKSTSLLTTCYGSILYSYSWRVYLKCAVVKEHHEGAVGLEPLQQVESGHVCIRHTNQIPTLTRHKNKPHWD